LIITIPSTQAIKEKWEKIDIMKTIFSGEYSIWISPDRNFTAQIHEEDGELVCVIDNSADEIIYADDNTINGLMKLLGVDTREKSGG
jgi:hypothetical protein